MDLNDHAYKLLQSVRQELQSKHEVRRSLKLAGLKNLQQWSEQHELETGDWLSAGQARFTPGVLARIDDVLQQLRQPLIAQVASGQSRREQAGYGLRENKSHGRPMRGRLLMLSPLQASAVLPFLRPETATVALDVAAPDLDLAGFAQLLVVENLDVFYELQRLQDAGDLSVPVECRNALIVYRGHGRDSGAVLELVGKFNGMGRKTLYFGDFDAAGLCIALQNGYSHVLLPALEFLRGTASAEHNDPNQYSQFYWLGQQSEGVSPEHPLYAYLQIVLQDLHALKQQQFGGELHCLPIPEELQMNEVKHV